MRRPALALLAALSCFAAPPAWAKDRVYMSMMGETFRINAAGKDPFDQWFELADRDSDGNISRLELQQDAQAFFASLDLNGDKLIDADEMVLYERESPARIRAAGGEVAPLSSRRPTATSSAPVARSEVALVTSGNIPSATRVHPGGGRADVSAAPQPVAMADVNLDRRVTVQEFNRAAGRRFTNYDVDQDGKLSRKELR